MENFFKEFKAEKTKEAWMKEVEKDLKGKPYEKINWKTYEGITFEPYYKGFEIEGIKTAEEKPGDAPFVRSNKAPDEINSWDVIQEISVKDPLKAQEYIKEALEKGADGIDLILNCMITGGKNKCCCSREQARGIVINTTDQLGDIFASADMEKHPVNITAGVASKEAFDILSEKYSDTTKIKGSIDNDPLKYLALRGSFNVSEEETFSKMKDIFSKTLEIPEFKGCVISNGHFHEAGSTIVQKIAYMLSTAVFYKERTAPEISFDRFARNIKLSYSAGQYYLLEIAGLRALRMLWSNISSAYSDSDTPEPADISVKTSLFNKTLYDPYVNMLRTTTEAMSAVIGGCNSLTVLPFDVCLEQATPFSMRIARNTQLVLKEEAHFDRFADPGAGSYYIEKATHEIARKAWELFNKIEKEGGILKALERGDIQSDIEDIKEKRIDNFRFRKDNLTGTNHVADPDEVSKPLSPAAPAQEPGILFNTLSSGLNEPQIARIKPFRIAEEFEKMRKATEEYNREQGKEVTAFMATVGDLKMRKARASFSYGFLAAGGFRIIDNNGFKTSEEAVEKAMESKAEIIVICSSDKEYAVYGKEIASMIKDRDRRKVVIVAGYPKDIIDDLETAGTDHFIHVRSDSVRIISSIQKQLGIFN